MIARALQAAGYLACAAGLLAQSDWQVEGGRPSADTKDGQILNQITEEMRSMRNHFVVVTLTEGKRGPDMPEIVDPVPLISNEFVDTRSAFLEKCQMYHWQFDELRNAQHSTLMLLYHLHGMHKAAKAKQASQSVLQAAPHAQHASSAPVAGRNPAQVECVGVSPHWRVTRCRTWR